MNMYMVPLSPKADMAAFWRFALSETGSIIRYLRELSREKPNLRRLDRWAYPGGEPKAALPRAPCARSPRGSKLGRKPEAFPRRGRSLRTEYIVPVACQEKETVLLQICRCRRKPEELSGNVHG